MIADPLFELQKVAFKVRGAARAVPSRPKLKSARTTARTVAGASMIGTWMAMSTKVLLSALEKAGSISRRPKLAAGSKTGGFARVR